MRVGRGCGRDETTTRTKMVLASVRLPGRGGAGAGLRWLGWAGWLVGWPSSASVPFPPQAKVEGLESSPNRTEERPTPMDKSRNLRTWHLQWSKPRGQNSPIACSMQSPTTGLYLRATTVDASTPFTARRHHVVRYRERPVQRAEQPRPGCALSSQIGSVQHGQVGDEQRRPT